MEPLEASTEPTWTVSVVSLPGDTARIGVTWRGRAATSLMIRRHGPTASGGTESSSLGGGRRLAGTASETISSRVAGGRGEGNWARSLRSAVALKGGEAEHRDF